VQLKRRVAIKAPHAADLDADTRKRVLAEAQAAARCKHPNLCTIYDVIDDGARVYIVMEYVEGRTLEEWARAEPRPTPWDVAQKVAVVARAAHAVHLAGYVHRDIKPANVLIENGDAGRPVLLDFGLARHVAQGLAPEAHNAHLKGTPAFLAPEQVPAQAAQQGSSAAKIGPAVDVYALGATLYALLTGEPPFAHSPLPQLLGRILTERPAFPADRRPIHPDLRAICLEALAKAPEDRYPSAAALADDLERFVRGDPVRARQPGPVRLLGRW